MSSNIIGKRIEELRNSRKMSQEELGSVIGVKRAAINKYERGTVTNIPKDKVEALADFFGVAPSYLYGWDHGISVDVETDSLITDPVRNNIRKIIAEYKKHFTQINEREHYKWEAIHWYKQHWDLDAPDFASMIKISLSKAFNLLSSGMYYPYKVLTEFAEEYPEEVRSLFRLLYDESIPFIQRYDTFRAGFDRRIDELKKREQNPEKKLQHFQDLRAVMVYLSFEYPEKYFLFKSSMYTKVRNRIGFKEENTDQKYGLKRLANYTRLCQTVLDEVLADKELISMSASRLDASCYQDPALHLLVMDIIYCGSEYMFDDDFKESLQVIDKPVYWPSPSEFDPHLSKDDWKTFILKTELPDHPDSIMMLKALMELGGEATCKKLAKIYGGSASHYVRCSVNLGKRVKEFFNLPSCMDGSQERYFPFPFLGRYVYEDNGKYYSYLIRPELYAALQEIDLSAVDPYYTEENEPVNASITDVSLNTILYGPPGTGKTYHTVIYAVAIIENRELATVESEDYSDVLSRYNEYKAQGRIEFTTFHQSYGYEEFIEGIKPVIVSDSNGENQNSNIQYRVESGIFKRFCELATDSGHTFDEAWRALITAAKKDNKRYSFTRRTGSIINTELRDDDTFIVKWNGPTQAQSILKKDKILSQWKQNDYSFRDTLTGGTRWDFDARQAVIDELRQRYSLKHASQINTAPQNYVFIIDEINRGNISKIFGELITLIEASKRLGQPEGMKAVLPYSQKYFGVPKNVYIIGTMNTADRSIATIDTALRRRFFFREMLPNPNVLSSIRVEDLSISDLLTRMNKKITALYDREHTIGHAYFMPLADDSTIDTLAKIFENNIIPLLQEYFYEDYEKIRLILGDNRKSDVSEQFIISKTHNLEDLFGASNLELDDVCSYQINQEAFEKIEAYRSI